MIKNLKLQNKIKFLKESAIAPKERAYTGGVN